jgi:hypothetical protein
MKTLREFLLKRHRSAEPKLDQMWAENLSTKLHSKGMPTHKNVFLTTVWTLWRELIQPSRQIWAGLACVWILIAVLNLASSEPAMKVATQSKPQSGEDLRALLEQRQMLAQLIGPLSEPAYTRKHISPGPRSERAMQIIAA